MVPFKALYLSDKTLRLVLKQMLFSIVKMIVDSFVGRDVLCGGSREARLRHIIVYFKQNSLKTQTIRLDTSSFLCWYRCVVHCRIALVF